MWTFIRPREIPTGTDNERDGEPPAKRGNIRHCAHCGLPHDWRRSTSSSLNLTRCGTLCEKGDLGFTIEALLEMKAFAREPKETATSNMLPLWGNELLAA